MKKQDTFNAVEFMRKRRDELSELHSRDPKEYDRQLKLVRTKYKQLFKVPKKGTA